MVIYFSGTGNSRFIAKRIAKGLNETVVDFTAIYKENRKIDFTDDERIVFVYPTYAGRMPAFMADYLAKQKYASGTKAYFVTTCGTSGGNQYKNLEAFCKSVSIEFMNFYYIVMPENYIALFAAPSEQKAKTIVEKAKVTVERVIAKIAKEEKAKKITGTVTSTYNEFFYKLVVKASPFRVKDSCVGCGKCERACVMNNVTLESHRPVWRDGCTHCMACISVCPTKAIEYGCSTKNKRRYYLEDEE